MPHYTTEAIRNIALLGNEGAGKTSLTEALLCKSGVLQSPGSVEKGTTVADFDDLEKKHHHSLDASIVGFDFNGAHLNVIDTPGYPDFIGRALSVLPAVETAVVVINARSGIDMNTRRLMQAAEEQGLCRMIVVNQIDGANGNLAALLEQITEEFGGECLPMNLPANGGQSVIDCYKQSEGEGSDLMSVADAHTRIVEQIVEVDDDLMEVYLEQGETVESDQLHNAFEKALREGHLIPICFTSTETGAGVGELLELMATLMPNPLEGNPHYFIERDEKVEVSPDPDGHVVAHVFKVRIDAFMGKVSVFRIHRGRIGKDTQLFVGEERKPVKTGHLFQLQGKENIEIDEGIPGDIVAIAKVDAANLHTVLHDSHDEDELRHAPVKLPEPMYGLAITAKVRGEEQKLSDALQKLAAEDPSLRVEHHVQLNETVIRGLGDLHLRIVLEKMRERYNVEVETSPPKIPYRETIRLSAEGHCRHKKQTGGAGQFGEVYLRVEPLERGAGFEFEDKVVGGVIPRQFIPAVEKGVRQVLESGAVAGFPLHDLKVTVYDGKHHSVDSKEVAFVAAGKKALTDAIQKARPVLLEPIVELSVTVPQASMGDVTGHLAAKRGRIQGTESLSGGLVTISGDAPLAELESYQSELKSLTAGAGSYSMSLSHYHPVPSHIQDQLVAAFNPAPDED